MKKLIGLTVLLLMICSVKANALIIHFYAVNPIVSSGTTGNVISLIGNNTTWSANTFTLTGGSGASITAQTITDTTHATITVTAGSGIGAITVGDGVGPETTLIFVETPAWNIQLADNFNRANTSVGSAGTTTGAGNNWKDVAGSIYSIQSDQLNAAISASSSYNLTVLTRPSSESILNERLVMQWPYNSSLTSGASYLVHLRQSGANTTFTSYTADSGTGGTGTVFAIINNSLTDVGDLPAATLNNGDIYQIDFSVWGANPTTGLFILTDITACVIVGTTTFSDSSHGPQTAGFFAAGVNNNAGGSQNQNYSYAVEYTTNAASGATSYSVSGPSAGTNNVASSDFSLQANGTSSAVVTPANNVGGTFSPTTVTLNGPSPVTFTYTPTTVGISTISFTNNGSLTNPSSVTYTSLSSIPSSSTLIDYSGRWAVFHSSSVTINCGASFDFAFSSSTQATLVFNTSNQTVPPEIEAQIDDGNPNRYQLSSGSSIQLVPTTTSSAHHVRVWAAGIYEGAGGSEGSVDEWDSQLGAVVFTGIGLDNGGVLIQQSTSTPTMEFIGDSITGSVRIYYTGGASDQTTMDGMRGWPAQVARNLGYRAVITGFGGTGIYQGSQGNYGSGNVPMVPYSFPYVFNGVSYNPTIKPSIVVIEEGFNDAGQSVSQANFQNTFVTFLGQVRTAYPKAQIFVMSTPNLNATYIPYVQNVVTTFNDPSTYYLNYGTGVLSVPGTLDISDNVGHPNIGGSTKLASRLAYDIQNQLSAVGFIPQLSSGSGGTTITRGSGSHGGGSGLGGGMMGSN